MASMNRMASQVLTSAEKIAASASAPTHTGNSASTTVGSTTLMFRSGWLTRAAMPSSTGTNENSNWVPPATPMPRRTALALTAP